MIPINPALAALGAPPIPAARAWMARYDGAHGPPIDLSQAAPGSPPPPELLGWLGEAAAAPDIARYGPILGETTLREALAAEMSSTYGGRVEAASVAITAGCNLAFLVAMMTVAAPGEAVILPAPSYFNHAMTLAMMGVETKTLPCRPEAGFTPTLADAERLIDAKTRALVLVTPNNPTGAIYPLALLRGFADLCRARGLALVLDETYRDFLPDDAARAHDLFADPDWGETLIHLYSFSKSHGVPGHRLGALVAAPSVIAEAAKVLDSVQICPARPGQIAIARAIPALKSWREAERRAINARIDRFRAVADRLAGWRILSIGAYFAYVRSPFAGVPAARVAERMAAERGVLALPGSFFGADQDAYLRFAFANAEADVIATLPDRLKGLSF